MVNLNSFFGPLYKKQRGLSIDNPLCFTKPVCLLKVFQFHLNTPVEGFTFGGFIISNWSA